MAVVTGICKKCGQAKRLAKSHIIPQSFCEIIKGSGKYTVVVNANKPFKSAGKFLQSGPYDDSILCLGCEGDFSDFDSYGWQILGPPSLSDPVLDEIGKTYAYRISCNTDKIRRFLLSVLWRASVSSLECFSRVKLGPRSDIIKARIFDPRPLQPDEFPITAARLQMDALGKYQDLIFEPLKGRIHGLISHVLYLPPDLKFVIATGRGSLPDIFRPLLMTDPSFFYLLDNPKGLMIEPAFLRGIIGKLRMPGPTVASSTRVHQML
jgi:hypothetical protein